MKRTSILLFALLTLVYSSALARENKYTAFQVTVVGHGRPVILIPGATCGGDEWKETIAHFGNEYEFHVLTLAGYAGAPPLTGGPYLETIKNQIEAYITDKKLNDVTIVGHSIGGFLSIWIASDMKTNLRNVLVVDGMPFFAGARNPAAADTFSEATAKAMLDRYNEMNDSTFKVSQLSTAKFLCADSTRWGQIVLWGATSDKKTMAYTMTEMLGKDLRKKIADIKVPVLVLAAYASMPQYPMYTRETVGSIYEAQYKACATCTVHVAEGGTKHFIMYDNPTWFYKEMNDFLSTQ